MDFAWLEERALRYAARWETSAASVARLLERKIYERCEESGESPDIALEMIPALVAKLLERGYVDDHRFATGMLERQRQRGRLDGPNPRAPFRQRNLRIPTGRTLRTGRSRD